MMRPEGIEPVSRMGIKVQGMQRQIDEGVWDNLKPVAKWAVAAAYVNGVTAELYARMTPFVRIPPEGEYQLCRLPDDSDGRFSSMAQKLADLWPKGLRNVRGREYAWVGNVADVRRALRLAWLVRRLDAFTEEDVLSCARRYLSRYSDDARYMMSLRNWVFRQREDAGLTKVESMLADMLEGKALEGLAAPDVYEDGAFDVEERML